MALLPADPDPGVPPREAFVGSNFEPSLTAKVLAGLFAAGATLALLTVALPHAREASQLGLLVIIGTAYVVAALLFWRAADVPTVALPLALALGSSLITLVAYFSAQNPSPLVFFYLWVFLYSSYFFRTWEVVAQILYVGALYGALLIARPPLGGAPEWWLVGMGTLAVAAVLIRTMRERVEQLIARLYDASRTDPLTGLSNRRGFREQLDLELARARRSERPMTVIVGDLDHFKEVNDRSGRQVGNAALTRVARVLELCKRDIDGLARIGGEEFALILPDTNDHGAFIIAERMRCDLQDEFIGDAVAITISFGLASYPRHGQTAAALMRATDEALRAAKWTGRNRTMLHSPTMRDAPQLGAHSRDMGGERFLAAMLDLAEAVDLRFSGSQRHSETVGRYAEMMARELGLSEQRTERVRLAGVLHDIGKVGVSDDVLHKPAKLTDDEFKIIKRHPELGSQILEHASLEDVRQWVGAHHERPDGLGYPLGLGRDAIPLEASIVAVADAYEAMTSDRSYRASMTLTAARAELERCSGTQFDARVVRALITLLESEEQRAEQALAGV